MAAFHRFSALWLVFLMVLHVTCVLSVCYLVAICMLGGTGGSERRRITTPSAGMPSLRWTSVGNAYLQMDRFIDARDTLEVVVHNTCVAFVWRGAMIVGRSAGDKWMPTLNVTLERV